MAAPPLTNTFETGLADGTAITTGNSGGGAGNAWNTVQGTGGLPAYSTTQVMHGSLVAKFNHLANNQQSYVNWTGLGSITTYIYCRYYLYLTAFPNFTWLPVVCLTAAAGVNGRFNINTFGLLVLAQNDTTQKAIGTVPVALNQWVRIEGHLFPSTTVSTMEMRMWNTPDDSGAATDSISSVANCVNAANIDRMDFGLSQFDSGLTIDPWFDDIAVSTTGWIGPALTTPFQRRFKRLYGPAQLSTSPTDLYTTPDSTRTRVRRIYANNPSGSPVTLTAQIEGVPIIEFPIPAGESYEWAYDHALEAGEALQAYAGTGSALVLVVDGVEEAI